MLRRHEADFIFYGFRFVGKIAAMIKGGFCSFLFPCVLFRVASRENFWTLRERLNQNSTAVWVTGYKTA